MRSAVLMAKMSMLVFWVVTPCELVVHRVSENILSSRRRQYVPLEHQYIGTISHGI
jgi:hypothetical protein